MGLIIRKYSQSDPAGSVVSLYRECFDDYCPEKTITDRLTADSCWIAEVDSVPVGFLISNSWYLWSLGVLKEYRKLGIASRLIAEFETSQVSETSTWLHVHRDNPAQKLYFDLGYRVARVAVDHYGGQQDGLVMVKKLQ